MRRGIHNHAISTEVQPGTLHLFSLAVTILGILGTIVFLGIFGIEGHWYWTWRGPVAMGILASSCVVGGVLALIALVRFERFWVLTVFDLLLNLPLPLMLLWAGLSNLANWLRYG